MIEHIVPEQALLRRLGFGVAVGATLVFCMTLPAPRAEAQQPCAPVLQGGDGATVVKPAPNCPQPLPTTATPDYNDPVAGVKLLDGRRTIQVESDSQLASALNSAQCGQTIQLAPGSYRGSFKLNRSCPANNPVIVKGAAGFKSTLDGEFMFGDDSARNILTAVNFSGPKAQVRVGGINNKVIANKLTGWGDTSDCNQIAIVVMSYASHAEIAYNEIYKPGPWATSGCSGPQARYGLRTQDDNETDFPYHGWVHHNYFHDFPTKPDPNNYNSGQNDAMEIGQTQGGRMPLVNSGWYIERNRIENHMQRHGTVDLKVGGVVYRYNTFINVPGRVDLRGSTRFGSIIESNYHRNSGGSTVHGKDHKLVCNDFDGTITLKAGDITCDAINPKDADTHAHVCDVLVSGNKANLVVGKSNGPDEVLPARNAHIRSHNGKITIGLHEGLLDERAMNLLAYQCDAATETTPSMVGPDALAGAPLAYKAARGL